LFSLLASYDNSWLSSRYGKLEHIEGKTFGRIILGFESYLTRFINWVSGLLTWSLDHYKTTLAIVLLLFFSSIALIPAGFIGGGFFALQIAGVLVQIEMPKDASLEQTNFMTQKPKLFKTQEYVQTQITTVGQTSEGLGSSQATAYKAEIDVKWLTKTIVRWCLSICSKIKRKLENVLVGAKVKLFL
jgi:HAE1 family hydrophobic/amphiphilic exporter-1